MGLDRNQVNLSINVVGRFERQSDVAVVMPIQNESKGIYYYYLFYWDKRR